MEQQRLTNREFYFCYDKKIFYFLIRNNINYICYATADSTQRKFWLYHRDKAFVEAMATYNAEKNRTM